VRKASTEDLGWKVGAALTAEWTLSDDPRIGHGHDRGRNVFTTAFALNGEVADTGFGKLPHTDSIGE
jgi:hypothetical protein